MNKLGIIGGAVVVLLYVEYLQNQVVRLLVQSKGIVFGLAVSAGLNVNPLLP